MKRPTIPLLILLLAALAWPAYADQDRALALVDDADEALDAERFETAAKLYTRALEASDTCIPARYGLARALLALEREDEAIVALRQIARAVRDGQEMPSAWQKLAAKAGKLLEDHDKRGAQLETAVDEFVADLVKLAAKYRRTDPDLADRALDRVLKLRPDHARALQLRGQMSAKGARKQELFDGKQVEDWDGGRGEWWSVEGGVIRVKAMGVATFIRNQERVEGNFDVILEARITKPGGKVPFIALMAAWNAEFDHARFGILNESVHWFEYRAKDDRETVLRKDVAAFRKVDPSKWTTYELRFREDRIIAVLNGKEIHTMTRPKRRAGGYVGILAQDCEAEIRRVDVLHR